MTSDDNPYQPPRSNLETSGRGRGSVPADAGRNRAPESAFFVWEFEYKISAARWIFSALFLGGVAFGFGILLRFSLMSPAAGSSARSGIPVFGVFTLLALCGAIYCIVGLVRGMGEAPLAIEVGEKAAVVPHPSRRGELLTLPYRVISHTVEPKRGVRLARRLTIFTALGQVTMMSIGFRNMKEFTCFKLALHERMGVKK